MSGMNGLMSAGLTDDPILEGMRVIVKVVKFGWGQSDIQYAYNIHGTVEAVYPPFVYDIRLDQPFLQGGYVTPDYTTELSNLGHEYK